MTLIQHLSVSVAMHSTHCTDVATVGTLGIPPNFRRSNSNSGISLEDLVGYLTVLASARVKYCKLPMQCARKTKGSLCR